MFLGLASFISALFPVWSQSSRLFVINVFPLVGGALAFYAGLTMLRLSEFGRKFVVALLSIRVAINTLLLLWLLLYKNGAWLGVNYFGEQIFRIENRYAYPVLLLAGIVISLLIIIFLFQSETRKIFRPEATDNADAGKSNPDGIEVESDIFI
jgi:magnesium-transporting ATPase (P-type)